MNDQETLAIETRIDATLFRRRYWVLSAKNESVWKIGALAREADDRAPEGCVEITPTEAATWERGIACHREFLSDWSLLKMLTDECAKLGWEVDVRYWRGGDWTVGLHVATGWENSRTGTGKSQPEALSLAIVAVLDATEGKP